MSFVAKFPSVQISYHIESRVQRGESVRGRDRNYIMPSESIRVLSLVPAGTWRDVIAQLFESARSGLPVDPGLIDDRLDRNAAATLRELAVDGAPGRDAEEELRVLEQTLAHLGKRRLLDGMRETTLRFRQAPDIDATALLAAKQRELDAKRAASSGTVGLPPDGRR